MKKIIGIALLLGVVVFVAYHALIIYDNNFRYGRMRVTPAVRPHEEPLLIMETELVPVTGGEALHQTVKGEDLQAPWPMHDPAVIADGETHYFTFCAQCHGPAYDGNGTVGQSFSPLPTDLRSAKVQSQHAGMIFKSISYSVPGARQPAMATTIRIDDRWRIVAFIKALGPRE
ncbi:MAG: c-type cytochrome [Desulfobacterales bacterium]|nr:MAG: c-type cytochrome [Desulfobacterales bacterium]